MRSTITPIPSVPFPENIALCSPRDEPMVHISEKDGFIISPQYFLQGIPGAGKEMFVRHTVYEKLCRAEMLLPAGFRFVILDAWRPYTVQKGLFDAYTEKLREKYPGADENFILSNVRLFVSPPSEDPVHPAVHATGGAVDLTIADANGTWLAMGTPFDDFTALAHTDAFEKTDCPVRENRRLLYAVMTAVGFTNLPSEWWHYDYGDGFWAFYQKTEPLFSGMPVLPVQNIR